MYYSIYLAIFFFAVYIWSFLLSYLQEKEFDIQRISYPFFLITLFIEGIVSFYYLKDNFYLFILFCLVILLVSWGRYVNIAIFKPTPKTSIVLFFFSIFYLLFLVNMFLGFFKQFSFESLALFSELVKKHSNSGIIILIALIPFSIFFLYYLFFFSVFLASFFLLYDSFLVLRNKANNQAFWIYYRKYWFFISLFLSVISSLLTLPYDLFEILSNISSIFIPFLVYTLIKIGVRKKKKEI